MDKAQEEVGEKLIHIMENNDYMQMLGMELIEVRLGYARGKMKCCRELSNPYGSMHGGSLYSLADVVSGTAACVNGKFASTVSGSMNFIRPAMNTNYVYCEAKEVRTGTHLAVYDVTLVDDKDSVLETGCFTFFIMNEEVSKYHKE